MECGLTSRHNGTIQHGTGCLLNDDDSAFDPKTADSMCSQYKPSKPHKP